MLLGRDFQLAKYAAHIVVDGFVAQVDLAGNLRVGLSVGDQF